MMTFFHYIWLTLATLFGGQVAGQGPWSSLTQIGSSEGPFYVKSFYSQNVQMNWTKAVDFCRGFGLQLASVESASDQFVITEWAKDSARANAWGFFWLSGTDEAQEGYWRWLESGRLVPTPGDKFHTGGTGQQYWILGEPTITRETNCLHVNLGWYMVMWGLGVVQRYQMSLRGSLVI